MKYIRFTRKDLSVGSVLATLAALFLFLSQPAFAQTETVLYAFTGGVDGALPVAGVTLVGSNVYGTTTEGGAYGFGNVFAINRKGTEKTLFPFTGGADGGYADGALLRDKHGNFYGVSGFSGAYGYGNVFQLSPSGVETVLYSFSGGSDGAFPSGRLVFGKDGNLYGTTQTGGDQSCSGGCGVVFKLTLTGEETVLHAFSAQDGSWPMSGVVFDKKGNLYGTTSGGGAYSDGTVYEITKSGTYKVLHHFSFNLDGVDGSGPMGALVLDKLGNLYGTTYRGGVNQYYGTIFMLTPSGNETVLHSFNFVDGSQPQGTLLFDKQGNLYGTTIRGGTTPNGYGTVFKLTPGGVESVLYKFTGGVDGSLPTPDVALDSKGNIYGTTLLGGYLSCDIVGPGCGVVFKVSQ